MQRTTAPGSSAGMFVDDNPAMGIVGTLSVATDRNAVQEEIIAAISGAGLTPSASTNQLWAAIQARADLAAQTLVVMKNKFINGDFRFWQRGTSLAVTTGQAKYQADRWRLDLAGTSAASTYSRQAFTLGQTSVPGEPKYFARSLITNGGDATNGQVALLQFIEDVRSFAGRNATISFWAKADAVKSLSVVLNQTFGTGGSPSASVRTLVQKVSLSASWQKFTMTIAVPSISGKTLGTTENTSGLAVEFWQSAGSAFASPTNTLGIQTGTFDFANIQVEEGVLATSFEQRPDGMELALCQRYYEKSYNLETVPGSAATGEAYEAVVYQPSTTIIPGPRFKASKRTAPTFATYSQTTGTINTVYRAQDAAALTSSAPVAGISGVAQMTVNAPAAMSTMAYYHWVADAEF